MAALDHPHIVTVYEVGEVHGGVDHAPAGAIEVADLAAIADRPDVVRRALERETDLSLREDPDRRRTYTSMDLPRSRSPSDERSLPPRRHHRHDELTWNGETLTLVGWSQRTGIRVEVLLRRCRRGWSVEQVLTTPPGEGRVAAPPA